MCSLDTLGGSINALDPVGNPLKKVPGDKPSPARAGESLGETALKIQGESVLAMWYEC